MSDEQGPRLTANVLVCHPVTGVTECLLAGARLPDWAAGLVGGHALDTPDTAPPAAVVEPPPQPAGLVAPPRTGAGSSKQAWVDYAAALGVQVDPGASRDDIIAACEPATQADG